jgi:hypothetical protein
VVEGILFLQSLCLEFKEVQQGNLVLEAALIGSLRLGLASKRALIFYSGPEDPRE